MCGSGQLSRYSDLLRAGRSEIPGAHPAPCTMGTGFFPGAKRPGRGVDHPPLSSAEVKERVGLYIYSPSGPSWSVLGRTLLLPSVRYVLQLFQISHIIYTCFIRMIHILT